MAFHLWTINEIYTNVDGTIQYIELFTTGSAENELAGHTITSTPTGGVAEIFTIPNPDGISGDTTNKTLLFATQGFADLGIVTPDFIIPAGFLPLFNSPPGPGGEEATAGTLNVFGVDTLTFSSLPKDGTQSIDGNSNLQVNSPKNFAGTTGSIPGNPIVGTNSANTLTGTAGIDFIVGLGGNDTINGGTGNDIMRGETGDDQYVVSDAGDVVIENNGAGTDIVLASLDYILTANVENLTLTGTAVTGTGNTLANVINGNDENNVLNGQDGNDILAGGLGLDTLDGGTGQDTAVYAGPYRQHLVTGNPAVTGGIDTPQETDNLTSIEKLQFVDGSLNFDPLSHVAQVGRLYEAALDRAGDALGINGWATQLDAGASLIGVAQAFVVSAEFQSTYGSLDNTQFIEQLYLNVLDRPSDPDGLNAWLGFMAAGHTRGEVVVGFSESGENITNHAAQYEAGLWDIDETAGSVARLYWGTLDRAPDAAGLTGWVNLLKGGGPTLLQVAGGFVGSVEFQSTYGNLSNADFISQLYLNVLERAPSAGEVNDWVNVLATNTREAVALGFTDSGEYQAKTIGLIDQGVVVTNVLQGTGGADTLTGTPGPDTLNGVAGADILNGGARADILNGGAGDDTLNGDAGVDTAVYAGLYRQHLVTGNPAVTGSIDGPEDTDALASIEKLQFVDGSLNFDPLSHVAQVGRLYEAALDRSGDALGINGWATQLDAGASLSAVAQAFVDSAEFQSTYGGLNDTQFIEQLYLNVLDRAADAPGLAAWLGFLAAGHTRGEVVVGFSESGENITNHAAQYAAGLWDIDETAGSVARLYWGTLDRAPDAAGLTGWVNLLKGGGVTLLQVAGGFVGSVEFQSTYGNLNDSDFINQLYLNVLERAPSAEEVNDWVNVLATQTREAVALGFTDSTEFQVKMIAQIDGGITATDGSYVP